MVDEINYKLVQKNIQQLIQLGKSNDWINCQLNKLGVYIYWNNLIFNDWINFLLKKMTIKAIELINYSNLIN